MADGTPIGNVDFDSHNPGLAYIEILFSTTSSASGKAEEMNIHVNDCGGTNRLEDLKKLTRITLPGTGGPYEFNLSNPVEYSNHVHYDIVPQVTLNSDNVDSDICQDVNFFPTVGTDFRLNEYNAVYNDATKLRRSEYIFEVDDNITSGSSIAPQNIQSILDGTAVTASVQDSNYSSITFTSGRYTGTKTDKLDYGIGSALSGKLFRGKLYDPVTPLATIASQSEAVNYEELLFTIDPGYNWAISSNKLEKSTYLTSGFFSGSIQADTPNARFVKINSSVVNTQNQSTGPVLGSADFEDVGTGQTGSYFISGSHLSVAANLILHSGSYNDFGGTDQNTVFFLDSSNTKSEFFQVERVEFTPAQPAQPGRGGTTFLYLKTGSRNYPTQQINTDIFADSNGDFSTIGTYADHTLHVNMWVCLGDTVFKSVNNKLQKVGNKKLLVEETGEILYINENGQLIWNYGYKEDF